MVKMYFRTHHQADYGKREPIPKSMSWLLRSSAGTGGNFSSLGVLKSSKDVEPDVTFGSGGLFPCTIMAVYLSNTCPNSSLALRTSSRKQKVC